MRVSLSDNSNETDRTRVNLKNEENQTRQCP